MRGGELENRLAALGIGGGLAVARADTVRGDAGSNLAPPIEGPPRTERRQGPGYVVTNHEGQYSIWPQDRRLPKGYTLSEALRARETCRIDECGRLLEELEEHGGGL